MTRAQFFIDDLAACRALHRLDLPVPPQLHHDSIRDRHLTGLTVRHIETMEFPVAAKRVTFVDGSMARIAMEDEHAIWQLDGMVFA